MIEVPSIREHLLAFAEESRQRALAIVEECWRDAGLMNEEQS